MPIYQALIDGVQGERTLTVSDKFIRAYNAVHRDALELVRQNMDLDEGVFYSIRAWNWGEQDPIEQWDFRIEYLSGNGTSYWRLKRLGSS